MNPMIWSLLVVLCAMLWSAHALASEPTWRSQWYPEDWQVPTDVSFLRDAFLQDFSYAGYQRGERPISRVEGPLFPVSGADASGQQDATAAIQRAIDAAVAAGGGVVTLGPGTFRLSLPEGATTALHIHGSGVVLRGAGADATTLINNTVAMRQRAVLTVGPRAGASWRRELGPGVLLSTDLLHPTRSIPLVNGGDFQVGDWVALRSDASAEFIADLGMGDLWGSEEARRSLGGPLFYRQITAIDAQGQTITVDAPIRWVLLTRDRARVVRCDEMLEEVGIEDLAIGNVQHPQAEGWREEDYRSADKGAWDTHDAWSVRWNGVRHGWMRDVHSARAAENSLDVHMLSNGVQLRHARSITLERVSMQRPQYGGGGGNGYMIRFSAAQECLVVDCEVAWNRHGFVFSGMQTSGNVILRGRAAMTGWQGAGRQRTNGRSSDHHMHLSQSNLIDGVTLAGDFFQAAYRGTWGGSAPHGLTATQVVYWNLRGEHEPRRPWNHVVESEQWGHGYIIGTRGPVHGVQLPRQAGALSDPIDHVEGIGQGDLLQPKSLYDDQLKNRLRRLRANQD